MELDQCAGQQYRKADARLNAIYHKALDLLHADLAEAQNKKDADQIKYVQQAIDKLKAAERAWIQYRDLHCEAARHQFEGGSMSPMIWGFCMAKTTLHRIDELKSAYEDGDRKLE
ncbi:MAG: lysozyme inhibitor LprI family protein, partial [Terriglobales bacterium]